MYLCSAIGLCFLLCFSALGQGTTATLSGTVTDESGAVIPGANITVKNVATGIERQAETNENGSFIVPLLPPSEYTVAVNRDGFAPTEIREVVLNVNDQRALNIQLKVGDVSATVTVDNEPSLVEQSAAQSTTVDRTFAGNLPLNGRSLQSLFLLAPGVVPTRSDNSGSNSTPGGFSVNGQRTNSNYFTVDGVSANVESTATPSNSSLVGAATNGSLPALSALGTTSTLVSVDALEEFKIQTSTFSAEYGRQPGGQVQLVTRSGGTDFHGSIYDYVRNDIFDANNFFNNARGIKRPPLRQNNFGGTFSGPVFLPRFGEGGPAFYNGRKRTFFFFSYEGLRLRLPNSSGNVNVPSLRLRSLAPPAFQPVLNAYPLPTGAELTNAAGAPTGVAPFQTVYSNPSSTDSYSIRLDHNLTNKITIFGRYNQAPSSSQIRTLNVLNGASNELRTLTVGTTFVASSNFNNDFRFNYSRNRGRSFESMDDFGGAVPIDASLFTAGYSGPGPVRGSVAFLFLNGVPGITLGDSQDSYQRQINVVDTVSLVTGAHQFKFGVDFRRLMPTYAPAAYTQSALVGSQANLLAGTTFLTTINAKLGVEPRFNNYSFYVQDTWKASQRLTLDLGLRYEFNPAPKNANGVQPVVLQGIVGTDVSGATLAPSGTPFFKPFKTAFAPRFGAVYQLRKKPGRETVMRGGFGVYYDLGNSTALNAFDTYPFQYGSPTLFGAPFPLTPAQAVPATPPALTLPLPTGTDAIDPDLKLPYTLQYNFGIEQSLGKDQVLSVSYVGSGARRLLATQALNQRASSTAPFPNPNIRGTIFYTVNGPTSSYNSLQAQYQRRLSSGLQALVNYTWSHSIDEGSDELNASVYDRGNSAFDVRHNFSAALTYIIPKFFKNRAINAVIHGWSANSIIFLQSGQPIDIIAGQFILPDGRNVNVRPDYVAGQPLWIEQAGVPGGRRINPAAFVAPPRVGNATSAFARQGTFGRNVVTAPGIFQVNFGLQREFKLTEALRLNVRGEAFNLFNRPQFASYRTSLSLLSDFGIPNQTLNNNLGGVNALYQIGGPRSLQFSARLSF